MRSTPESTDQLVAGAQAMLHKHPGTHSAAPQTRELISQSEALLRRQKRGRARLRMLAGVTAVLVIVAGGVVALFLR